MFSTKKNTIVTLSVLGLLVIGLGLVIYFNNFQASTQSTPLKQTPTPIQAKHTLFLYMEAQNIDTGKQTVPISDKDDRKDNNSPPITNSSDLIAYPGNSIEFHYWGEPEPEGKDNNGNPLNPCNCYSLRGDPAGLWKKTNPKNEHNLTWTWKIPKNIEPGYYYFQASCNQWWPDNDGGIVTRNVAVAVRVEAATPTETVTPTSLPAD